MLKKAGIPLCLLAALLLLPAQVRAQVESMRGVWVTRFDYSDAPQISKIMADCREAGFDTVFFQVRGTATVTYRSDIEPMSDRWHGSASEPDALTVAIEEAHRHGLKLHAWLNLSPVWGSATPPADPKHLYNLHPEWLLVDQHGKRQPLRQGLYVSLNPCLPEVRRYLASLCSEVARGYSIDGLHLDFAGIVAPKSEGLDYPYDAETTRAFKAATGQEARFGSETWRKWRCEQVTAMMRDIRREVLSVKPAIPLSAAVSGDLRLSIRERFCDAGAWCRQRAVDFIVPMLYTDDFALFSAELSGWHGVSSGVPVVPGIGLFLHRMSTVTEEQIEASLEWPHGYSVFSYAAIYGSQGQAWTDAGQDQSESKGALLRKCAGDAPVSDSAKIDKALRERCLLALRNSQRGQHDEAYAAVRVVFGELVRHNQTEQADIQKALIRPIAEVAAHYAQQHEEDLEKAWPIGQAPGDVELTVVALRFLGAAEGNGILIDRLSALLLSNLKKSDSEAFDLRRSLIVESRAYAHRPPPAERLGRLRRLLADAVTDEQRLGVLEAMVEAQLERGEQQDARRLLRAEIERVADANIRRRLDDQLATVEKSHPPTASRPSMSEFRRGQLSRLESRYQAVLKSGNKAEIQRYARSIELLRSAMKTK